jgi:hypothetical protein
MRLQIIVFLAIGTTLFCAPCAYCSGDSSRNSTQEQNDGYPYPQDYSNASVTKTRFFRLPMRLDDADRKGANQFVLWVSADKGKTWEVAGKTTAEKPHFSFKAPGEGIYLFRIQTVYENGIKNPANLNGKADLIVKVKSGD